MPSAFHQSRYAVMSSFHTLLMENLLRVRIAKGTVRKASSIICFPYRRRVVGNAFGILRQNFKIYQMTLKSLAENAEKTLFLRLIFCTGIRAIKVQTRGILQMNKAILQIYQDRAVVTTEVRDKFKQIFISLSGSVPLHNKIGQC